MNLLHINIAYLYEIATIYSLVMIGIGLGFLGSILPTIIGEARVHNGLAPIRRYMLNAASAIFVLGVLAFTIIGLRYIFSLETVRAISWLLLMIFATTFPIYGYYKRKTYKFQFSPEQKALHEMYEKQEQLALKKKKGVKNG